MGGTQSPDSIKYQVEHGTFNSTDALSIVSANKHRAFLDVKRQYPYITEGSYFAWYGNAVEARKKIELTTPGMEDGRAQQRAVAYVDKLPIHKLYEMRKQRYDSQFTNMYPAKADELNEYYEKYPSVNKKYTPTKAEKATIQQEQLTRPQP